MSNFEIDITSRDFVKENYDKAIIESIEKTLQHQEIASNEGGEISVLVTNDKEIQELNEEYRHQKKPTNVLSFPLLNKDELSKSPYLALGDIVISIDTLNREADEQGKDLEDHLKHLVVHSVLHLLGYDHMNDHEQDEMESIEVGILKGMNINNPYVI